VTAAPPIVMLMANATAPMRDMLLMKVAPQTELNWSG
jgi:hypothetical protein